MSESQNEKLGRIGVQFWGYLKGVEATPKGVLTVLEMLGGGCCWLGVNVCVCACVCSRVFECVREGRVRARLCSTFVSECVVSECSLTHSLTVIEVTPRVSSKLREREGETERRRREEVTERQRARDKERAAAREELLATERTHAQGKSMCP